jgi:bifunctional non-homologous end joining protein LigD
MSRNGNDLTGRFREVARAAAHAIRSSDAVLDGEICALDEQGRSRFSLLQEGGGTPVLVLFDVLELESEVLTEEPLAERRTRLERLVGRNPGVLVSPQFDDGQALLVAAREQELEGVVAKKRLTLSSAGAGHPTGRSSLRPTQEVVIAGYTRGQGRRAGSARSSPACRRGQLRWAGNVGRLLGRRDRAPSGCSLPERTSHPSRRRAEDASRAPSRRCLGGARARRRGRVR